MFCERLPAKACGSKLSRLLLASSHEHDALLVQTSSYLSDRGQRVLQVL